MGKAKKKGLAPAKKAAKAAKSAKVKVNIMTHANMTKGFKVTGASLRPLLKKGTIKIKRARPSITVKPLNVSAINSDRSKLANKKWGPSYRNLASEMDELVSTSSVRDTLTGALGGTGKITASQMNVMEEFFNAISDVRFPTEWSGFAKKGSTDPTDRMQHPTAKDKGMWRENIVTGDKNPHSQMDRLRRQEVFLAMKNEAENGGDLQSVLNATLTRAISFTLNEFTAPATANDQSPAVKNKELLYQQVKAREKLKEIGKKYGAVQEKGNTDRGRAWGDRRGKRSLSPARTLRPADEKEVRAFSKK